MEFLSKSIQNLQAVKIPQWALYVAYAIGYLCALPFFQHQTDVDTLGYLAAAERYASGDFYGAINGFWSALMSWFMVPFLLCNVPAILALKLVNLIGGLIGIRFIYLLANELNLLPFYVLLCQLVAMPHLAHFSLCVSTADVLSCVSWIAVVYYAFRFYANADTSSIFKLALAGTISYFTKNYHFYAFILLLGILFCFAFFQKKPVLSGLIKTFFLFLLLSSTWVCAIYWKHGVFSPTTAATLNLLNSQHPDATNHPQLGERILPLNYDQYLYTAWEYVPDYLNPNIIRKEDAVTLNWLERTQQIVPKNIVKGARYFYIESILLLVALFVLYTSGAFRTNKKTQLFTVILVAYPLGYYATFVEFRYLQFCLIATIIMANLALQNTPKTLYKGVLCVLLTRSFLLPFHRMNQYGNKGGRTYEMNNYFNTADQLKGKHIVSSPGTWPRAMVLCYQSKAKYYDTLFPEKINHINPELIQHQITYYFCLTTEVTDEMKTFGKISYFDNYALIALTQQ